MAPVKGIYFFILILTTSGCVSSRRVSEMSSDYGDGVDFTRGTFHNTTEKVENVYPSTVTLLSHLSRKFLATDSIAELWKDYDIELIRDSIDDNRLRMNIFSGDTLIEERVIKGRWKRNNFYVRRLIRPIGLPFVYFWYYEKKIILSWSENNLYIHKGECKAGMILLFSGGSNDYSTSCYAKK